MSGRKPVTPPVRRSPGWAYFFWAGGLLVRPPPDGAFGTLPGQFGALLLMVFLVVIPGKKACAGPGRTSRTLVEKREGGAINALYRWGCYGSPL